MKKRQQTYVIVVLVVALVLSFGGILTAASLMRLSGTGFGGFTWPWGQAEDDQKTGQYGAELPINIIVNDEYKGGTVASATVKVYEVGAAKATETLTTGTDGSKTGSVKYESGDVLDIYVVKSNSKMWFHDIRVPFYTTEYMAAQKTAHDVSVDFWTLGTYGISVVGPDGVSISNNGNLNKTETAIGSTPTLTITIRNTADDTGFLSSEDPVEGYVDQTLCFIKTTGTNAEKVVMSSPRWARKDIGTDYYWGGRVADADLTRILDSDGTVKQNGVYTFDMKLDLTSYTGDAADLIIYVEAYTCWEYFNYYGGAFGSDAVELTTITINLVD